MSESCLGCSNERACLWGDSPKSEARKREIADLGTNTPKAACPVNIRLARRMKRSRSSRHHVYSIQGAKNLKRQLPVHEVDLDSIKN